MFLGVALIPAATGEGYSSLHAPRRHSFLLTVDWSRGRQE